MSGFDRNWNIPPAWTSLDSFVLGPRAMETWCEDCQACGTGAGPAVCDDCRARDAVCACDACTFTEQIRVAASHGWIARVETLMGNRMV